jgi:hypothetical protein
MLEFSDEQEKVMTGTKEDPMEEKEVGKEEYRQL